MTNKETKEYELHPSDMPLIDLIEAIGDGRANLVRRETPLEMFGEMHQYWLWNALARELEEIKRKLNHAK